MDEKEERERKKTAVANSLDPLVCSCVCVCVCVCNPVIQGSQSFTCLHAGGTWGMKRSGANEDTSSLPVISALDAELTYLQKGGQDPYPPKKSGAFPFGETRFSGSDERNSTC